ncbi:MAG TPA: DinB family protein, partial [Ktedonobacterales bacterium]|nr:DinB family protein [Ktedonobacterales bacterium]
MRTEEVLQLIDRERAAFDAVLSLISRERLVAPGAAGVWSAKDIVAHVTWAEREMVGVLRRRELVGSDLWELSQDERNAAVNAQNRDRGLDDVLDDARSVFAAMRAEIARLSDEQMNDPQWIARLPAGLTPWQLLAGNTWKHYEEHLSDLQ